MNKQKALATVNMKIDALIIKEKVDGILSPEDKASYKRLCKFHKELVGK